MKRHRFSAPYAGSKTVPSQADITIVEDYISARSNSSLEPIRQ